MMDEKKLSEAVSKEWDATITPTLQKYIEIPNQSPLYDPQWATNGYQEKAMTLLADWVRAQNVPGLRMDVLEEKGRTPMMFIEIDSDQPNVSETILMYGHMDKQPPMTEFWEDGLGPWKPVIKDGKLYGRGGADDGYSVFCAVTSIKYLRQQGISHSRIVITIEGCEESGSPDLPFWMDKLDARIGTPSLVICLDSGCGNYEQLWLTTSLRGITTGTLSVKNTSEGVHSGASSGIVPSTSRVMRQLLDRLEDPKTGEVMKDLHVEIPAKHVEYAKSVADTLGASLYQDFPFLSGVQPVTNDLTELCLNKTWRPTLTLTGAGGFPSLENAGNVMRPETAFKLSIRLPPTKDPKEAADAIMRTLTENPPYGSHVKYTSDKAASGWMAPLMDKWLEDAVESASKRFYNKSVRLWGEGGSIPFMGMLGRKFPGVQFAIVGVLGPKSNAHGPNEFIHLDFAKKLTCCVSSIVMDHYKAKVAGKKE